MYCEKPDENIIVAKLTANVFKNRYRDISPCKLMVPIDWILFDDLFFFSFFRIDDSTRVKIKNGSDEDYINASHVNVSNYQ